MIRYQRKSYLTAYIKKQKKLGKTIGFIPTMGALHQGHLSLIKAAKEECDIAVCSIFVNPTQFNNKEDLDKYPRFLEEDMDLLKTVNCDIVFTPSVATIYPKGKKGFEAPVKGHIVDTLEGFFRPGHFHGMMQVVSLLLDIIQPTHLYMGLKDYQQFAICSKMVANQGRAVEMRGMPIVREKNGLAMSSRNERLSEKGKAEAGIIFESLQWIKENIDQFNIDELEKQAKTKIESNPAFKVEYLSIVDQINLEKADKNLIVLCAVWLEGIRLIDNLLL